MENLRLFGSQLSKEDKNEVILNWMFASENDHFEEFIIEKSLDNNVFKIITRMDKIRVAQRDFSYLFIDNEPATGNNYYRLLLKKKGIIKRLVAGSDVLTVTVANEGSFAQMEEESLIADKLVLG